MTRKDPTFYLDRDRSGLLRGLEAERDALALEANGLRRIAHAETAERMTRLGLPFAARYASMPPPYLRPDELHASRWPTDEDADRWEVGQARRPMTDDEREELASMSDEELTRRLNRGRR